jgi:hypothetical protein
MTENNALTLEQRQAILQNEIRDYVSRGYSVQSVTSTQAVLSKRKKVKVITHLFLAFVTVGFWLIIPLIQIINRKQYTVILTVDSFGKLIKG